MFLVNIFMKNKVYIMVGDCSFFLLGTCWTWPTACLSQPLSSEAEGELIRLNRYGLAANPPIHTSSPVHTSPGGESLSGGPRRGALHTHLWG